VWLKFYRYLLGIPREEYEVMPYGEMIDLINCHRLMNGASEKVAAREERPEISPFEGIPDLE